MAQGSSGDMKFFWSQVVTSKIILKTTMVYTFKKFIFVVRHWAMCPQCQIPEELELQDHLELKIQKA